MKDRLKAALTAAREAGLEGLPAAALEAVVAAMEVGL